MTNPLSHTERFDQEQIENWISVCKDHLDPRCTLAVRMSSKYANRAYWDSMCTFVNYKQYEPTALSRAKCKEYGKQQCSRGLEGCRGEVENVNWSETTSMTNVVVGFVVVVIVAGGVATCIFTCRNEDNQEGQEETPIPAQVNTKAKAYGQRVIPSNLDAPPVMAPDAIEYN